MRLTILGKAHCQDCCLVLLCARLRGYWVKAPDDRPRVTIARTEIIKISIIFISTNMTPIEAALDSLKLLKLGETPNYAEISKKYGCDRNTLSRRH